MAVGLGSRSLVTCGRAVIRELGLAGVHAIAFEPAIQFDCHVIRPRQQPEQALVADFLEALHFVARENETAAKRRIKRSGA